MNNEFRVILAGGGTGGHVFPAIYMAEFLKKHLNANCMFIGTKKGIENIKVSQSGFLIKHIWISGFKRGFYLRNFLFPLKLFFSLRQSKAEIIDFTPDIVIGTGGYVSGPVLYQAAKMGIPTVIQEQNSYPGITTRILASKVDCVFVAYKESLRYLKNVKKHVHVGNPISDKIGTAKKDDAQKYFGLQRNKTTVLVFGGSQGSKSINSAVDKIIQNGITNKVQIIWQTGESFFEIYKEKYKNNKNRFLHILPFIDRMDLAYCISDFAICRAGAMTISELAAAHLPAILIPYPYATAAHQLKNATTIVNGGGALLVEDNLDMEESLKEAMMKLITSPEQRDSMSEKIGEFHRGNTLEIISSEIKKIINNNKNRNPSASVNIAL